MNEDDIQACVKKSYKSNDNEIFSYDASIVKTYGVIEHPNILINYFTYKGDIYGSDVFQALCAAFR